MGSSCSLADDCGEQLSVVEDDVVEQSTERCGLAEKLTIVLGRGESTELTIVSPQPIINYAASCRQQPANMDATDDYRVEQRRIN